MKLTHSLSLLNRRAWIKVFILGTVTRAATTAQTLFAELVPSNLNAAIIPVRPSAFTELQQVGGSIALYFCNHRYPIVVTRGEADAFFALDPTCTHAGCQVNNYNAFDGTMYCDCHGSNYDIQGRVTGGPAEADLTAYRTSFDGNDLVQIELPGVPLRIAAITVQAKTVANTRLRLQFPGTSGCKYRLRYSATLTGAPQAASFAMTATGSANQSSLTIPFGSDGVQTVWVDAPGAQGFFAVEMVLGTALPL